MPSLQFLFRHSPLTLLRLARSRRRREEFRRTAQAWRQMEPEALSKTLEQDWSTHGIKKEGPKPIFLFDPVQVDWNQFKHGRVLGSAEKLLNHTVNLLGSGDVSLGSSLPWHRDFIHDYSWPTIFSVDIPFDFTTGADIKVPWELSRLQHLATLGIAFRLTSDRRYVAEYTAQIRHWIEENPVGFGVNWKSAMDSAIRACNLLLAWQLFEPGLDENVKKLLRATLWQHGYFLMRHVEYSPILTTNHYLADLVGLFFLGTQLRGLPEAGRWERFARRELEREILKQVEPDGGTFEHSTSYQRLDIELFAAVAILARRNGQPFSHSFSERLKKMFAFTASLIKPNGLIPQFGDNDDGRLFIFTRYHDWERRDHRYLLDIAYRLFPHDFATPSAVQEESVLWTAGLYEPQTTRETDVQPPVDFPNSGITVLRSGVWYTAIKATDLGQRSIGGHDHNDLGSFELNVHGEDIVIDPGTYQYTADPSARNLFRSTEMHNVLQVDDGEYFDILKDELFRLEPTSHVTKRKWNNLQFSIEHDGFVRLTPALHHIRRIQLDEGRGLTLEDRLTGQGPHRLVWHCILAPNVVVQEGVAQSLILSAPRAKLVLAWDPPLSVTLEPIDISPSYGVLKPSHRISFEKAMSARESDIRATFTFHEA